MRNEEGLPEVEIIIRRGGVDAALVAIFADQPEALEVVVGLERIEDRAAIQKALEAALHGLTVARFD